MTLLNREEWLAAFTALSIFLKDYTESGEADYAYSLLTATNDRSWWNMIKIGSTITMEAWDMKYKPNSDWNHAWGAAPANIIPGYMWGITPDEPGFSKVIIRPQLSNLKHTKVIIPTIRGTITAEFTDNGSSKEFNITIPGNMKCDFILPVLYIQVLTIDGKKCNPIKSTISLNPGNNKIIFE